jgi:hypothetical protein
MLTVDDFIKAGYKRFDSDGWNDSDFGLQKLFSDEKGKKYFITLWVYDFSKYKKVTSENKIRFSPDVQFTMDNGDRRVTINLHINDDDTVEYIEKFYEDMWYSFKSDYYQIWE